MSDSNQYTNSKVQAKDFTSGWMIALVLAGLGVSLPMLYLGAEVALNIGFWDALIAFGVSTLVLTILCVITTLVGNRSRLSTYMILRFPFGKQGAKIINLIFGLSLLGWFSVALELLAQAIQDTAATMGLRLPLWGIVLIGSVFITVTTIYGIKTLEKLANIAVPILLVFLLYVVYVAIGQEANAFHVITSYQAPTGEMTLFEGISILVGASILVPVLMADFSRYVFNDKHSLIAVLGVTIGTPLVYVISAIIAIQTGEVDIIQMMKTFNLVLPAFVLIFVSTWVTNATNLYSISLTFNTIVESLGYTKMCIISSVIGTTMALLGFSTYFMEFLNILGVFTPSIATIYILDFFWLRKQQYDLEKVQAWGIPALVSWGISSIIALLTYNEVFSLTGAYFVDSLLIAGICYWAISTLYKKR